MKLNHSLEIIIALLGLIAVSFGVGVFFEGSRTEPKPQPPKYVIESTLKLYQEDIVLPDSTLIGIHGQHPSEVYVFMKVDGGLKFVGVFKK